jgi:single-strand DNA-binding protein
MLYSLFRKKTAPFFDKNPLETACFRQKTARNRLFRRFTAASSRRYDGNITRRGDKSMINQVTLVGRLTKDPDLRTTVEGTSVTQISLAVSRNFRNHNGEIETDFITCTLWRNAAENTCKYCRKGSVVGVTGRLQSRHYDNRDGNRVYVTEVVAETIRFLSSKPQAAHSEPHEKIHSGAQQQTQVFHDEPLNSQQAAQSQALDAGNSQQPQGAPAQGANANVQPPPVIQQEERREEVTIGF